MNPKMLRILVINDSQEVLDLFYDILHNEEGHDVIICSYQVRDLDEIRSRQPDLLIVDQVYGSEDAGWKLIQKIRMSRDLANLPVIFCTTDLRRVQELEGHLAALNILTVIKPFLVETLLGTVRAAIERREVIIPQSDAPPEAQKGGKTRA